MVHWYDARKHMEEDDEMKMQEIKEIAKQRGVKAGTMKKAELIRIMQQEEGNHDCYETGIAAECGQDACLWREDCK